MSYLVTKAVMLYSPEHRPPYPVKEVALDEMFFPFSDKKDLVVGHYGIFPTIETVRALQISNGEKSVNLRFQFTLQVYEDNGLSVAPFHPPSGYTVTEEDMDLELRREKLRKSLLVEGKVNPDAPWVLLITANQESLNQARIPYLFDNDRNIVLTPDWTNVLTGRLLCMVCSQSTYIARLAVSPGFLSFDGGFYPVETGALAGDLRDNRHVLGETEYDKKTDKLSVGIGHDLIFGDNMAEISQIGITFTQLSLREENDQS